MPRWFNGLFVESSRKGLFGTDWKVGPEDSFNALFVFHQTACQIGTAGSDAPATASVTSGAIVSLILLVTRAEQAGEQARSVGKPANPPDDSVTT